MKPKPVSPPDGAAVLEVLDRRLAELDARDRQLTSVIIGLEKSSARNEDLSSIIALAEALLAGEAFKPPPERPLPMLQRLHAERDVVRKALTIGSSRKERLVLERAGNIFAAHWDEIAELERKRVILALTLQHINRQRELLRQRLTEAGGGGIPLCSDGAELLDVGDRQDETLWAVRRVIADGVMTQNEVDKATKGFYGRVFRQAEEIAT